MEEQQVRLTLKKYGWAATLLSFGYLAARTSIDLSNSFCSPRYPKEEILSPRFCSQHQADLTERAGFEPAVLNKEHTGFRNQLDQPLRHLSVTTFLSYTLKKLKLQAFE